MDRLPIDPLLPAIVDTVRDGRRLVLEAPPGAGKTTRVPPALLDAGFKRVLVLEPRRLAARLAATRVARERGGRPGEEVGYQVRFERVAGPRTRVLYQTEGVFTRHLLQDPGLAGVDAVVIDEFHERHLHGDLALAILGELRRRRPELAIVVMSATLETAPVAALLNAPVLRSEGRLHAVALEHLERADERPLAQQVVSAVRRLVNEGLEGDVLVFLPGAAEIRRARESLAGYADHAGLLIEMLHGDLPPAEQDRALARTERRKIILSTNVAESSVTIEGVVAVVDSGLHRVAAHSPFSGVPSLELARISQASATQRAGRAGRLRPGRCLRLYTRHDLESRPAFDAPEIRRADLAELLLSLAAIGVETSALPWLEPPPEPAVQAARELLSGLGAVDASGRLTARGRTLLSWPLHPRLGALLVEAAQRGVFEAACTVAALLGERDVQARGPGLGRRGAHTSGPSDLLDRVERLDEAFAGRLEPGRLARLGLEPGAVRAVDRARRQLLGHRPADTAPERSGPEAEDALRLAVLAAWPDRVARRRRPGRPELLLSSGSEVVLSEESVVQGPELLVAVDASVRRNPGRPTVTLVHLASAIEPEWLLELFPERIEESVEASWNAEAGRVEAFSRMRYGQVVLAEARESAAALPGAAELLADQALRAGLHAYADREALAQLTGRLRLATAVDPAGGFFEVDEATLREAVVAMCAGRTSLSELRDADLVEALLSRLPWPARRRLDELAPTHLALPGRKRAAIAYPEGGPPFVASRIQDFFGLTDTPRIGGGAVALQLRLLAPSGRPVQITQDLPGFWSRHYPEIRRELSRRYPRHSWPERP